MTVDYCVVSIGTLSRNRLWGESAPVRTAHATITAVCDEKRLILVDPSLPAAALDAVLFGRTGKRLADVTDVFCTTLRPVHRRGIAALPHAPWWADEEEIQWQTDQLKAALESAERLESQDAAQMEEDLKLLETFRPAPEQFTEQVTVCPLRGPTPGSAGLLLTPPTATIVIAGDAALTGEHIRRGQVWEGCIDVEQAMKTLADSLELADVIVPGHDNLLLTPTRWL